VGQSLQFARHPDQLGFDRASHRPGFDPSRDGRLNVVDMILGAGRQQMGGAAGTGQQTQTAGVRDAAGTEMYTGTATKDGKQVRFQVDSRGHVTEEQPTTSYKELPLRCSPQPAHLGAPPSPAGLSASGTGSTMRTYFGQVTTVL
jgi:hypothetical protein